MADEAGRARFLADRGLVADGFQTEAMDALDDGASVLVAAPTGSGKTLVAEYAVQDALSRGLRSFYTAPMKALSNQKHKDLVERFGADKVGLMTGDSTVNPSARILVMTTEVLRNMIYTRSQRLDDLGTVVLDEVHFLQDAYRGPVWEEVIIHLDPEVQLVCLSATVSNAGEVADWLTTVRGRTVAVTETRRPVELVNRFVLGDKATGQVEMHPTLVSGQPNEGLRRRLARSDGWQGGGRRHGSRPRYFTPSRPDIVDLLEGSDMLPAIVFIFSRAQCDDAVTACRRRGLSLTDADEADEIEEIVRSHCEALGSADRAALDFEGFLDDCCAGIAAHHAGMLPMYKEAVEECFARGLIKVVFATETLAVGVNMPARAVVIEKLTKYTGEHHRLLSASDFTQLTGRAGRRGLDPIGFALTTWSPWVGFDQVCALASSRSFHLNSAFKPTFNMAANLIASHSREETRHLLNLSFAQYQADKSIVGMEARIARLRSQLAQARDGHEAASGDLGSTPGRAEVAASMRGLRPGDVVLFDSDVLRGRGAVISVAQRRGGPRIKVVTSSRKVLQMSDANMSSAPAVVGRIDLPVPFEPARTEFLREVAARMNKVRAGAAPADGAPRPADGPHAPDPGSSRLRRLTREIAQLENQQRTASGSVVARFDEVVDALGELGYVDDWSLTAKGRRLAGLFHESDLLVVEMLEGTILAGLSAADLAAVTSMVVFEPRGGDDPAPRWPNDTVRSRARRVEKTSQRLQAIQSRRGLPGHRSPHPGLVWETHKWVGGAGLAEVIDESLTPGDFVRHMRQCVDLLRQMSQASDGELSETCARASSLIDRGVVAAAAGVG